MPFLELKQITKSFGKRTILKNLSLELRESELFVLVGASGCGKSTTLRIIAGLEEPDSGSLFFCNQDLQKRSPHQREIAMVFQSGGFFEHQTVRGNLAISLESLKLSRQQRDERMAWMIDLLGLEPWIDSYPTQLSGGQLQRLALGRGLIRQCKLLLLDEPLSHLDPPLRARLQTELIQLRKRLGISMLYVTHDPMEAMSMADRIGILSNGCIIQCDTPSALYDQPNQAEAVLNLGSHPMRFFDAAIDCHDGIKIDLFGQRNSIPGDVLPERIRSSIATIHGSTAADESLTKPMQLRIGLRPEAWSFVDNPNRNGDFDDKSIWNVSIESQRFFGDHWLVEGTLPSGEKILIARYRNQMISDSESQWVQLHWPRVAWLQA